MSCADLRDKKLNRRNPMPNKQDARACQPQVGTSVCSAPSYEEVCAALDKLHITCESAEPDVYRWYLRQPQASRARAKAIDVLNRLWQSLTKQALPLAGRNQYPNHE